MDFLTSRKARRACIRKPLIVSIKEQGQITPKIAHTHATRGNETEDEIAYDPTEIDIALRAAPRVTAMKSSINDLSTHHTLSKKVSHKSAPEPQPISPILDLPADIILHLSHHLTYNSLLAIRSTCRTLHTILTTNHVAVIRTKLILNCLADEAIKRADYRRIHPRYGRDTLWDLFSIAFEWQLLDRPVSELRCYGCLELKPLRMFVERMSCKGTGLGGRLARQRKCKDCMLTSMGMAGSWWREHWLRRSETVRRTGKVERLIGWAVRGTSLKKVQKGEEIGVCTQCGTGQFELFWGCAGCFEKEQTRRRREEWSMIGINPLDGEELEGWVKWVLERNEAWRGRLDKKKRARYARKAECGGKWYSIRRYTGIMGIDNRWDGSWGQRVESLVDHLEESYQRRAALQQMELETQEEAMIAANTDNDSLVSYAPPGHRDVQQAAELGARADAAGSSATQICGQNQSSLDWRPTDHNKFSLLRKKERMEVRCGICWTPSCRRRRYIGALTYGMRLEFERCCDDCKIDDSLKRVKREENRRMDHGFHEEMSNDAHTKGNGKTDESDDVVLEDLERLFAQ